MNNYSSPRIIRVLNKLDTLVGILIISVFTFIVVLDPEIAYDYSTRFVFLLMFLATLYSIIGLLKICSYTYCIFQGYRVTIIGMLLYIIWVLAISLGTAVFWVYLVIQIINATFS